MQFAVPIISRTERAHPTCVRPLIAVQRAFVIARGFQQEIIVSVHQRVQRAFSPAQKFLDYDTPACLTEAALIHHLIDGRRCGRSIGGNDHPFAQREAVRFDHRGKFRLLAITQCFRAVGKRSRVSRGDFLRAHQFFCENFGCLDARRGFRRAKRAQFFTRKQIDNSRRKRIVRADRR